MNLLDGSPAESSTPTPWAVHCDQQEVKDWCCNKGELIYLTKPCYIAQMRLPDSTWSCPRCGGSAQWSDENYEKHLEVGGAAL